MREKVREVKNERVQVNDNESRMEGVIGEIVCECQCMSEREREQVITTAEEREREGKRREEKRDKIDRVCECEITTSEQNRVTDREREKWIDG